MDFPKDKSVELPVTPQERTPAFNGNGTQAGSSPGNVSRAGVQHSSISNSQSIRPAAEGLPLWMQRIFLIIFVLLCIEVGLVLVAVPWTSAWSDNGLLVNLPRFKALLRLGFVRGIISGIGVLDIWIGIWEAVHYRDRNPASN